VDHSPTEPLHANRFTIGNTLAVPIRAETCRLMDGRKSHEEESGNANQQEGEENTHHVSPRRMPLRPSHFSILLAETRLSSPVFAEENLLSRAFKGISVLLISRPVLLFAGNSLDPA
jgi:hypothetical protein